MDEHRTKTVDREAVLRIIGGHQVFPPIFTRTALILMTCALAQKRLNSTPKTIG